MLFACRKNGEINKIERPDTPPVIELMSTNPTELQQFKSPIEVVIQYVDSNGDIGTVDPDSLTMEVKDSRLEQADLYHIPPIHNDLPEMPSHGEFKIHLKAPFLLGIGEEEVTFYTIKIMDRAGNWSNEVETPLITIKDSL